MKTGCHLPRNPVDGAPRTTSGGPGRRPPIPRERAARRPPRTDERACCPPMLLRLLATATAATALVFSPTPGVLVLSPALTGPRTTFSVGPHAGESYERVWREDPQFCVWALEQRRPVWKSPSVPCWLRRAVRNRHRHAIELASRRWRRGRRDDSERRRREFLISAHVRTSAAAAGRISPWTGGPCCTWP